MNNHSAVSSLYFTCSPKLLHFPKYCLREVEHASFHLRKNAQLNFFSIYFNGCLAGIKSAIKQSLIHPYLCLRHDPTEFASSSDIVVKHYPLYLWWMR